MINEIKEARQAAANVLELIDITLGKLRNVRSWSRFDLFLGDFFTSLVKRSKISDINSSLAEIDRAMAVFKSELSDVKSSFDFGISNSSFDIVFDVVFDNIFTDLRVLSEINELMNKLEALRQDVSAVYEKLSREL
ncbi:MAG: hypothetical protein GX684_07635 [Ruminococcaceae bacterium]|nr:hypothetical protein [Oscillospiraceae bacterium]